MNQMPYSKQMMTQNNLQIAAYLLHAHPLRHGNNAAVAFHCSCQGDPNTCRQPQGEDLSNHNAVNTVVQLNHCFC